MKPSVLMLSAERPYPLHGGGAYRTASLLHFFARLAHVDLVLLSETDTPSPVPDGLLRSQHVITLPRHPKTAFHRYLRNARRAMEGVPPLIDRLRGLEQQIERVLSPSRYHLGIAEHFWCAPYLPLLAQHCAETLLDLHNIESVLHRSCARVDNALVAFGQRRFAAISERLESQWIPRFGRTLVASAEDEDRIRRIAPGACTLVYPNALPWVEAPNRETQPWVAFAANFEYHPNIDAAGWLLRTIWPRVHARYPELRLRLIGRGDGFVRHLTHGVPNVDFTGPVPDTLPEVGSSLVSIAPLRAGSGTRIKVLESWAAQRATVATPLGAEGLETREGENILLAADCETFAAAICSLVEEVPLRERIAAGGRDTFTRRYCWSEVWRNLRIYNALATSECHGGYTGTGPCASP